MNYEDLECEFECYSAIITIQETFQEIYEIMGIADIGKNITGVIDATQKIADIAIRIQNTEILDSILELKKQLVDIKGSLVDAKEENVDLRQKNFEIQEENKKLKDQLESVDKPKLAEQLIYKDQLWSVKTDEHQAPVCRNCTEEKNRFIYLSKSDIMPVGVISGKKYKCPICTDSIVVHDEIEVGQYFIG